MALIGLVLTHCVDIGANDAALPGSRADMQVTASAPTSLPQTPMSDLQDSITFAGYTWDVKHSGVLVGPGPNIFSNKPDDVFVDSDGALHLNISQHGDQWVSTEVINTNTLGYGAYIFHIATPVDLLDPNIILGLFTWDPTAPDSNFREIDIEFSRWGQPDNQNSQFVVQPWENQGNIYQFNTFPDGKPSTHLFYWLPEQIIFQSFLGDPVSSFDQALKQTWIYEGENIPKPGNENVRINLWLFNGQPPLNGLGNEVVISGFEFIPWEGPTSLEIPGNVQVHTVSTTSLKIEWDTVAGADQYNILRSDQYDGPYTVVETVDENLFIDEGLARNQLFFYRIEAENLTGEGSMLSPIAWGVATNTEQNGIFVQFDGEFVTGKVIYHELSDRHRIVWWVQTDSWYIQPFLDDHFTILNEDGTFRRQGHAGNRARVYLVVDGDLSPLLKVEIDRTLH